MKSECNVLNCTFFCLFQSTEVSKPSVLSRLSNHKQSSDQSASSPQVEFYYLFLLFIIYYSIIIYNSIFIMHPRPPGMHIGIDS